ncbi:MAG: 30S ribosome-binding factor RbfA [Gammaproteobacteria bacterium]
MKRGRTSHRNRRLEEQLLRLLSDLVRREVKDPRVGAVTLTAVEVSPDLAHATVFFLPFGLGKDPAPVAEGLGHAAGYLRTLLGRELTLRHTPQLHFKVDTTLEKGMALNALINEAVADDRRRQAGTASQDDGSAGGGDTAGDA